MTTIALITGANKGIGLETARLLVAEGARVITSGRGGAPGIGEELHVQADLARPGEPEAVVEAALAGFGGIDCLVNNVGVAYQTSFDELTDEDWTSMWELNVMSYVRSIKAVLPGMRERGSGRIVNVSSTAG